MGELTAVRASSAAQLLKDALPLDAQFRETRDAVDSRAAALDNASAAWRSGEEVCRKHCISAATWYGWKSKYAGATVTDAQRSPAICRF